ncbi:PEP-CTERM sorting domain-containing protein [Chamaesiphon sp. VAR_48_metabat_135_sub]|uniref:PEP-CTERM sorting domain-containing protein n=1 Tax=Chamaesiphon sp. VAR_48_metabat_135_sub TaxID=2964699 RepID=UPI00286C93EA|nr:PEP-CTERM sorting domain-containing protein [Chamaesiphon sp. VAR_48_metabat_135_sub]
MGLIGVNPAGAVTFGNIAQFRIIFDRADPNLLNPSVRYDTPAAPFNLLGLFEQTTSGSVPIGTRSIYTELLMVGPNTGYNDTYADNLSLILTDINATATSVPEPSEIPGVLIGGALVVGAIKQRKQKL